MTDMPQRLVEGTITILRCDSCGATFPHFVFSGEEDTDTCRLCSASSCERNEVVLLEVESDEWGELERSITLTVERRLGALLVRSDLKIPRILAVEQSDSSTVGLSFKDFQKAHKPPVVVYTCICCASGKSRPIERYTTKDFRQTGGIVTTVGQLFLQGE
jgi:hypothetical protein